MKRFKRLAALFMAVAMLMTFGATTAVARDIDLTQGTPQLGTLHVSVNHDTRGIRMRYTMLSSSRPTSIEMKESISEEESETTDGMYAEIINTTGAGNAFETVFDVILCYDYQSIPASDLGNTITNTIVVQLANGERREIPYAIRWSDRAMHTFSPESSAAMRQGIAVGQSITLKPLLLDRFNTTADQTVTWEWYMQSGQAFAKVEGHGDTATLTGLAVGRANVTLALLLDGKQRDTYTHSVNVSGTYVPPAGPALDDAKDDLAAGNNAALDVAPNKGLSPSDLLDLKAAAGSAGAKVELTFDNDDTLKLSFDPAAIPDDWSGAPFTPAFTAAMPDSAREEGFSASAGKWLDFSYSGELPAPMTVTLKVAPGTYPDGTTELKVWYFDPATKALVEQPLEVVYNDATGTVTFILDHFSTYLICPADLDPNETQTPPETPENPEVPTPPEPPTPPTPPVTDSGDSSEDDSNSPESLRLVAEQDTWSKTFAALASEDSLMALPSGTAVINGQTVTAPLLTFNTDEVKQIPAFVVDRLAGKNALLKFTGKDITDSFIHGAAVQPTAGNRIFYRVADFLALYTPQE